MRRSIPWWCAALVLTACTRDRTVPDIAHTRFAAPLAVDLSTMTRTSGGGYLKDLIIGSGPAVAEGQLVAIHYVGNLADGRQFDANGPTDTPFTFRLGAGDVIAGFDQGVAGMRVGGKRQVIIPPELGYGAQGGGPIPPNAVLLFTIDLAGVQ